jgi:NAD(P)-dependent dehydrogenase (short-subunit alcohol dehydrogenase family)
MKITSIDQPKVTPDGYEEPIAVNHLAHFLLILELLPSMTPDGQIIIVGSDTHRNDYKFFVKKAAYAPLEQLVNVNPGSEPIKDAKDNGLQRYATSKMLQLMTGHEVRFSLSSHKALAYGTAGTSSQISSHLLGYQHRHVRSWSNGRYRDAARPVALPSSS